MSRRIDPIKKRLYKKARKKGKSITKSLKEAGYSDKTAEGTNSNLKLVKTCDKEIHKEFDIKQITVEKVLEDFDKVKQLALDKDDLSNYNRANEALGRYLAMFTDKKEVNILENIENIYNTILNRPKLIEDKSITN